MVSVIYICNMCLWKIVYSFDFCMYVAICMVGGGGLTLLGNSYSVVTCVLTVHFNMIATRILTGDFTHC